MRIYSKTDKWVWFILCISVKTIKHERQVLYMKDMEFDKKVVAYGHCISYEMFLRESSYVFDELIGPIYEIIEEEFLWGLQRR